MPFTRVAGQQAFGRIAVRTVATRACHLALAHRVRVRLHGLGALLLVAVEADVGLRGGRQYRVALDMHRVAIGTGDGIVVMRAAMPREARVGAVAFDAVRVLVRDRCRGVRTEGRDRRAFLAAPYAPGVITAGSVAGFALQLTMPERGVGILRHGVLGAKDCQDHLIVMTLETRVGALLAVVGGSASSSAAWARLTAGRAMATRAIASTADLLAVIFMSISIMSSLVELELADTVHLGRIGGAPGPWHSWQVSAPDDTRLLSASFVALKSPPFCIM